VLLLSACGCCSCLAVLSSTSSDSSRRSATAGRSSPPPRSQLALIPAQLPLASANTYQRSLLDRYPFSRDRYPFFEDRYTQHYSMAPTNSTSKSTSLLPSIGVRRLLHDLREVLEHPLPNVSCLPLEDDLYTWHGNGKFSYSLLSYAGHACTFIQAQW
jgi:hypothetical protein